MRSDTFSERVPRLSFVANFGENHVNHVLARSLGAFVYSRIDGNRPSVVQRFGIKCPQKWSGGAPRWAIFPETSINIEAPFSGAARVAVRRRVPSTLCSIASQVRNRGRRLEREPVDGEDTGGRVFDGNPQPAFFVWRGVFLDKSTAAAGGE